MSEQGEWKSVIADSIGYYFYVDFAGKEIAQEIRTNYNVLEESDWEYGGWIVHCIKFEEH